MPLFSKVEISTAEYKELLKAKEQLATVKRYVQRGAYLVKTDLEAILDIERYHPKTLGEALGLKNDLDKDDSAKDPDEEQKG